MNAGYVRLSKDDDKQNYVSIENQKLVITQYAASLNMTIDRWYEDDGVSGYKFDRPAFVQLKKDLNQDIDILFAKDFSRIGRHNAYVLLFLDEFHKGGKRLIVVDDDYDSEHADDDIIGIKTWYNERYVKDASKKIRRVLSARQKEGTLMIQVPFGYIRNENQKEQIEVVSKEARQVKMIYDFYIQGMGYRKIATYLNENNIPTPSMIRHERELSKGIISKQPIATRWSDSMVKDILDNDFYIGNYRLHKRARTTIHGADLRVPKNKQELFENHHPMIIDKTTYELVQNIRQKRNKHPYRGCKGPWSGTKIPNEFGSCLFCKDCGSRLTPIVRTTAIRTRTYYICSTYNTKGRSYCAKSHLIEKDELMNDVLTYIRLCRNTLCEAISTYDLEDCESAEEPESAAQKYSSLQDYVLNQKKQLMTLITQKIKDLAANPEARDIITASYDALQNDILTRIHTSEIQLKELVGIEPELSDVRTKPKAALDIIDQIILNETLDRRDMEVLIERITVDEYGQPDIAWKYSLSYSAPDSPAAKLNRYENAIILTAMKLVYEDSRDYTSAKFLASRLTTAGYKMSNKSVLPYIAFMVEIGILAPTENSLKPYSIIVPREELALYIQKFHNSMADWRYAPDGLRIYPEEKRHRPQDGSDHRPEYQLRPDCRGLYQR